MNMLDLMNKMTELSEARSTNNAFTGNWKDPDDAKGKSIIHKGKYGTAYQGEPDDLSTDDTKKTKKVAPADGEKRGRGRPAKGSDSSGKTTSHDTQSLSNFMIGNKPSKAVDKLPKTKSKTLKDWFERLDAALNEDGQFTVKPAAPGASDIMGPDGKKIGTASTPAAAQAVKNGEVNFDKDQGMAEGDIGKPNNATTGFAALVKKLTPKYGVKGAMRIAGSQMKKIKEADMPPNDSLLSPMSEGGNPFAPIMNLVKGGTKVLPKPTGRPGMPPAQDARTDAVSQARNAKRNADDEMWAARQGTQPSAARTDAVSQARNAKRNADDEMWAARQGTQQPALESKKGVNPFAKKKPDDDKDGVPNWADKKPGKDDNEGKKKGAAPKKGVNPFAKKKISEGKVKDIAIDLEEMTPAEFKKKYKMTKAEMEKNMNTDTNAKKKDVTENSHNVTEKIIGQPKIDNMDNAGRGVYSGAEKTATTKHRLGSHVYEVTTEQDGDGDLYYFIYVNGKQVFYATSSGVYENKLGSRISSALLDEHKKATAQMFDSDEDEDEDDYEMAGIKETHPAVRKLKNKLGRVAKQNPGSGLGRHYDNIKNGMTYKSLVNKDMVDQNGEINIPGFKDDEDEDDLREQGVAERHQAAGKLKKQMSKSMMEGVRHSDAAHLRGKAHAMGGENYNCRYTPGTNEANMYHMGFKEGLDECYGQSPMESYVEEEFTPEGEVGNMPLMTDENYMMDESPFSWAAKNTPTGKHFTLAGHDFTKTAAESMNPFMESLNKQLNALLNDDINEGMTVSISKGQQGTPDSVSVSAQDSEAEQLLSIIKSAGLGLFGGDNDSGDQPSSAMSMPGVSIADGGAELDSNINVVNDHDGMLDLIRKMTGQDPAQSDDNDYESEEHEHSHDDEEECGDCGNNPCDCEAIDEDETPDQEEFMATEDNAPDSGAQETTADENAEAAEDGAIAKSDQQNPTVTTNEDEMEEDLNESYANSAENTFEADIEFMTKVITGGLNKQKSTGQSTIPVVASQKNRLGEPMQESTALLHDWKKLSGIT